MKKPRSDAGLFLFNLASHVVIARYLVGMADRPSRSINLDCLAPRQWT